MTESPGQRPERVIVGLSGGVDSAVSALLLLEQGYQVEALFMRNWEEDDGPCPVEQDLADARQVAGILGIPLHEVNFSAAYRRDVFDACLQELRAGRTPNPDVLCNREIKFKRFLTHAQRLGADWIATGHYARVEHGPEGSRLLQPSDRHKDQTYFLFMVPQEALRRTLFPLSGLTKPEVRRLAEAAGFGNFEKKDSTGICFIGERDFRPFIQRYLSTEPGPIVTVGGQVIGRHDGLALYTIGQRRGLGVGGVPGHTGPWFVVAKDLEANRLIVAEGSDPDSLLSDCLVFSHSHWCSGTAPADGRVRVRLRHGHEPAQAALTAETDDRWLVRFDQPQRAVTPGQAAVVYADDCCLGGGLIDAAWLGVDAGARTGPVEAAT